MALLLRALEMGDSRAWAAALSPDGEFVAVGGGDGRIVVWDVASETEVAILEEHSDGIVQLDYGADATQLVSASDGTAIVWDLDRPVPSGGSAGHASDHRRLERLGNADRHRW